MGAPNVYFLNLDGGFAPTNTATFNVIAALQRNHGKLVIDARGYPSPPPSNTDPLSPHALSSVLCTRAGTSAQFLTPVLTGPHLRSEANDTYPTGPIGAGFSGPVTILIGPKTVSAMEDFSLLIADCRNVTFVGQTTAGTNGNITSVELPGGFIISFTGLKVNFPNGALFHGVGIVPDVPVEFTAADLASGVDTMLSRALLELQTP